MAIVTVEKNRYTVDSLYQWDLNRILEIRGLSLKSVPEIHFTNETMDKAIVRQASMDNAGVITVKVPNSLLQKPYKITVYVCTYEGNAFKSQYKIVIPVEARNKPCDYTLEVTDEEVYSFKALENAVVNLCNETVSSVIKTRDEAKKSLDMKSTETIEAVKTAANKAIKDVEDKATEILNTLENSDVVTQKEFDEVAVNTNSFFNPTVITEGLTFSNCEYQKGGYYQIGKRVFVNLSVKMTVDGGIFMNIVSGLPGSRTDINPSIPIFGGNQAAIYYCMVDDLPTGKSYIMLTSALPANGIYHIVGEYLAL